MRKVAVVFALVLAAGDAGAFCRKTTVDPDPTFKPSTSVPCWTEGLPLYWRDGKASYAIQKDASSQVSLVQTEDTMALAFAQWTGAVCAPDQKRVNLEVQFDGPTPNRLDSTDRTNVIMFDDTVWPHPAAMVTLALTTVTFDTKTGELIDADLEVNTANVQLSTTDVVPPTGNDFESIVTHESGHFLGLAHSIDPKATMFPSYTPGTKSLRTLAADDTDGICAIYPPSGCACSTAPSSRRDVFGALLTLAALALLTRRRRRPLVRGARPHSLVELESMPTKQLLGQLQRLRVCQENIAASDFQPGDTDYDDASIIFFKDDPRWRKQVDAVKRILGGREHVPQGPERKAKRNARAARSKSRARPKRR